MIKGYTSERELSRTGTRVTALAYEESSGRRVVLKLFTLPAGEAAANAARSKHRVLGEKTQRLTGGEFVPLLSWGEKAGTLFLVREHVEGMALSEILEAVKQLPVEMAGLLFEGIAQGVQKAHLQGIANLDLSPGNVIFRQDGKLVFTDWVKEEESASPGPGREQVQRVRHQADQNLDLFAMGALFARVLAGEPALGPEASEAEIVVDLSQRLRAEPTIPEPMAQIIHKLLGEEFERYDGAEEVLEDLKAYVKGLGEFDPKEAWRRFLAGPEAFVKQLNEWKAGQLAKEAKELLLKGRVKEAKAGFEKALVLDPDSSQAEAELELLGAREGYTAEKREVPPKPVRSDILTKLRATETPEAPSVQTSQEEEKPQQETGITSGMDWEQIIATSPRPLSEDEPQTSRESETFSSEIEAIEGLSGEETTPPSGDLSGLILSREEAMFIPRADQPLPEERPDTTEETPGPKPITLEPVIEKPLGEEDLGEIGLDEGASPPAEQETQEAQEEGRGDLAEPQQIRAGEVATPSRKGRQRSGMRWVFVLFGVLILIGAVGLIKFLSRSGEAGKTSVTLYQEGLRAQEVGDFDRALAKYLQVNRDYPRSPEARLALSSAANLEWRLGKGENALEYYLLVVGGGARDSLAREARFHRALILREQKKGSEALTELAGFIQDTVASKRTIEAKMDAAQLLHEQGMADSALAIYGLALSQDKEEIYAVEMYKERGLLREEKGDLKGARQDYDAILALTQPSDLSHVWAEQKASAIANKMMGGGR